MRAREAKTDESIAASADEALLSPQAGPLEPPIRALLFGPARFEQHGRSLARAQEVSGDSGSGRNFFPRLQDNIEALQNARGTLERRARDGRHQGPAAHWLLDNSALIDEQLHQIRRGLPRGFFRLLPRLRDEPLAGLPRIYGIAWAWVAHTDSGFDPDLLSAYLRAYQAERALSLAELWALPTTLRVVLIENLRRLAERLSTLQAARDVAHRWFDQDPALSTIAELEALEPRMAARGVTQAFLLQLDHRVEELPEPLAQALQAWLSTRLPEPAKALAQQQDESIKDLQSIRNAILTLRRIDQTDWRTLIAEISTVMQTLRASPIHAAEARATQDDTLHAVERLARESGRSEAVVARLLVDLTRSGLHPDHGPSEPSAAPSFWWRGPGQSRLRQALGLAPSRLPQPGSPGLRRLVTAGYLGIITLVSVLGVVWLLHNPAARGHAPALLLLTGLLLLGPVSEAVVALSNRVISELLRPSRLPQLDFTEGLPAGQRVVVAMPVLLDRLEGIDALCQQLEQHYLANPEQQAQFALLSDYADASAQQLPGDAELLVAAQTALAALNRRHPARPGQPTRFLLLHREREWSPTEQRWIGWERKRGKLEQLLALLAEPQRSSPFVDLGALSALAQPTRYLITLDADTDMPPGRLRALVGIAAHPINQPRLDPEGRRIVGGYAILQPRILAPLPDPLTATFYHQLFSGQCGIDPYSTASSESFQDLFGEGTFTGKGLMHVQATHAVLAGRLPEGQVLSHDLLEGSIARCAGISDVSLIEDAPAHADVAASRLHRWTRGDWQLLPFLGPRARLPLAAINRWKMLDNLRRSLVAPVSLALLLVVLATGVLPLGLALLVVGAAFCAGPLLGAVAGLAPSRDDIALRLFYHHALRDLGRALMLGVWHLAQLLQLGLMYGDAIARAIYRQAVSRRHLLQWLPAASAQSRASLQLGVLLRQHRRVPLSALALLLGLAGLRMLGAPVALDDALALLLLWAAAPLWTWLASRPRRAARAEQLDTASSDYLLSLARDTWRYYEQHIGPADHYLPPDNVQQTPYVMVAHRSSPTNFGLYLLAAACARELGFVGRAGMARRLQLTLDTLEKLPRWRGHFYNWYDTQSLAVLTPAYVSAVDSGNCSAHLLAVARACETAADEDEASAAARLRRALGHAQRRLHVLQPVLGNAPSLRALANLIEGSWAWPLSSEQAEVARQLLLAVRGELDLLQMGLGGGSENRSMWLIHDLVGTLDSALLDRDAIGPALREQLLLLAQRARRLALAADFSVLYDEERQLLRIGYRCDSQQFDDNHYDLLASEARLTSLLGIAKGDLPLEHWAALGRPFFAEGVEVGLKSWSGSMFEYLMPSLVLAEPDGSVLAQAVRSAVTEQRSDGQARGTPWGISESAIAGQDHTLAYQYGPQGAPRLALARLASDERVLAPYATVLAAQVAPCPAIENLQALQKLGARGSMGFYEALDYTPQRQTAGSTFTLVQTYMTHHQSMSLVALTNLLADRAPRRWLMSEPYFRAVGALLHERAPREVAKLAHARVLTPPRGPRKARMVRESEPLFESLPLTQMLTNGRYAVVLRSHGGGYSSWEGIVLNRWRDDLLRGAYGSFFYLRRDDAPAWYSITAHPAPDPDASYQCRMQAERVLHEASWRDLQSCCTTWVSPEDDCELRQIELTNTGDRPLSLSLAACFEATLAPQRSDDAHPAFSNLFVQVRWDAAERVLHLQRRPRLADEVATQAVHFLAGVEGAIDSVSPIADRARWLGRYGSAARPLGDGGAVFLDEPLHEDAPPGDPEREQPRGVAMDTGLDPLAGLVVRLQLPAGSNVRLTFCTAASRETETLDALIDKYRQPSHVERAASMSHTMGGIRLRELQFDPATWAAVLHLNTLVTGHAAREGGGSRQPLNAHCDRRALWRHGISGDRPIIWVSISSEDGLELVQVLKKALRLWSATGVGVDLVVSNDEPTSYLSPVQNQLQQLQARLQGQTQGRPPALCSTLHLLHDAELAPDVRSTLQTLARLKLLADGRPLVQQMDRWLDEHQRASGLRDSVRRLTVPDALPAELAWPREAAPPPAGEFDPRSGAFRFAVSAGRQPGRPWINVLANEHFGCQVSELGCGYTWAGNSRMHQVSSWSNDALCDPAGEWLLLQDLDQQKVWPLGRRLEARTTNEVEHGIGYSRITQLIAGLRITLTWCVDVAQPLKQLQLQIAVEPGGARRRLRLVALTEWQMGSARGERLSLLCQPDWLPLGPEGAGLPQPAQVLALQATQLDHLGGFGQATAFLALRPVEGQPGDAEDGERGNVRLLSQDWTCNRREFFDSAGRLVLPVQLGQLSGTGLDACAALAALIEVDADRPAEVAVLTGHGASPAAAHALLAAAWAQEPAERLRAQCRQWPEKLGRVQVRTPDPRFDALVNHWLPYQTLACRMWARAGFYQAGGAFGFRDQLQDAMALVGSAPELLAEQLRRSAARQFPEGDVQHWWHEPGGAGVRTHFSDDRLWLPLGLAHYVERTGNAALLDEPQPFLVGAAVPEGAEDIYETPQTNGTPASLYEHGARAIDCSLRSGAHGLPLFGTGDWNDGMNRVGHEGRGESVWLAWFLCQVIEDFAPLAEARGDGQRAARWRQARAGWIEALDGQAWDGRWYVRGFFDDGSPLGSHANPECRIDLIAQAWAVLSGAGDPAHARQAMASACAELIDASANLVRLLDPPLAHARPSAGYIQSYAPGVRENGGQYNHAAVWALMALARLGQREPMWQVFTALSPAHRWAEPRRGATYAIEPYVMAGDVYTHAPWVGRGGWSWYSGSAGWLLRAGVESICGVVLRQGRVRVDACLPAHWPRAEVRLCHNGMWHRVLVCANEGELRAALAEHRAALRVRPGEEIDLGAWPDGSIHVALARLGEDGDDEAALGVLGSAAASGAKPQ
ncbi:MAG: glucoamylase family protein [Burkholderiaceae bacterium]